MQKAKELGGFLLVGLHTDEDVAERRGPHLPIMDLHERCLSVLACKYVDEVIIGQYSSGRERCIFIAQALAKHWQADVWTPLWEQTLALY